MAEQGTENPGAAILLSRQKERGAQRTAVWTRLRHVVMSESQVRSALCSRLCAAHPELAVHRSGKSGSRGLERVITEWAQVFFWDEEHNGIGNTLNATRMGHCVLCEFHLS